MIARGSKTPIIILSYHLCEIHCCHLDGYRTDTKALLNRLSEIETELLSRPTQFRIWYNVDENRLDSSTIKLIAESITRFHEHVYKIAFIGLRGITKWRFNRILVKTLKEKSIPKAYFLDAELAKGWLV